MEGLGLSCTKIFKDLRVDQPYVLVIPTYADGEGRGAVPKPVIHFLNDPHNRSLLCGVISGGNRNFGPTFGLAGDIVAQKCGVPNLYKFELAGTDRDTQIVKHGLQRLWDARLGEQRHDR